MKRGFRIRLEREAWRVSSPFGHTGQAVCRKVIQPCTNGRNMQTKPMNESRVSVPVERIEKAIYLIRGEKVMLDRDLARLYEVPTKALKQAVRRNIDRFPVDFMFVLDRTEFEAWKSQFVTSKTDRKGLREVNSKQ